MTWKHLVLAAVALVPHAALAADGSGGGRRSVTKDGPVTLTVSVDKAVAQVADPIHLTVEVVAPLGIRIQLPQLPQALGDFDLENTQVARDIPLPGSPDQRLWVLHSTLETIKTGQVEVPSLEVQFANSAAATTFKTLHSEPIRIDIASVLEDRADPTRFRDIKQTVNVPVPEVQSHSWVAWSAVGVGGVVLAAVAVLLVAGRRRGPTPAAWALAQIADLEQLQAEHGGDAETIYNELVNVLREFFEYEFNVPALSHTSREFLGQAGETVGLGEASRRRLGSLVAIADQVKFARFGVSDEQLGKAFDEAKALVHECDQLRQVRERKAV